MLKINMGINYPNFMYNLLFVIMLSNFDTKFSPPSITFLYALYQTHRLRYASPNMMTFS